MATLSRPWHDWDSLPDAESGRALPLAQPAKQSTLSGFEETAVRRSFFLRASFEPSRISVRPTEVQRLLRFGTEASCLRITSVARYLQYWRAGMERTDQLEDRTMAIDSSRSPTVSTTMPGELLFQEGRNLVLAKPRDRQSCAIRELRDALAAAGFVTLDAQAKMLGLCRSTTWTILKGRHKGSGLSATTINRVLAAPQLPPLVRVKILEYVEEKAAGRYGHSTTQRRKFIAQFSINLIEQAHRKSNQSHPTLHHQL